jgi:hypothetical protein
VIVHVVLSLVVWFYSFTAALLYLLPERSGSERLAWCSPRLGMVGVLQPASKRRAGRHAPANRI